MKKIQYKNCSELKDFCASNGIKLNWIARKVGMSPSLFKYHLSSGRLPINIHAQVIGHLRELANGLKRITQNRKLKNEVLAEPNI